MSRLRLAVVAALVGVLGLALWPSTPPVEVARVQAPPVVVPVILEEEPPSCATDSADIPPALRVVPTGSMARPDDGDPETVFRSVLCPLDHDLTAELSRVNVVIDRPPFGAVYLVGEVTPEGVRFEGELPMGGRGLVEAHGYAQAELWLDEVGCAMAPLVREAAVHGYADGASGVVEVYGCGAYVVADPDGWFFLEAPAGDCLLEARTRWRGRVLHADPLPLTLRPGEDVRVSLAFPDPAANGDTGGPVEDTHP